MKRIFDFVIVLALSLVAASALIAQNDAMVGTWKLNLAKSKYTNSQPPKNETRTVEAQGNALKISYEGVTADGSKIAYSITSALDGKDVPISGVGQANGADSIAIVRVDANRSTTTLKKAGKTVATGTTVLSKDGKTYTVKTSGTNAKGEAISSTTVWDKQ